MRPSRQPSTLRQLAYFIAAVLLFTFFGFFLSRPFVESSAGAGASPRWLLLFAPLDDPTFMEFVWRGLDLPAESATGERWFALGLGVVATLALLGLGKLAFAPFKRLLKTNIPETIFFQFGAGFALWNLYVQIAGLLGFADAPVALATFVFAAFYVLSSIFAASRRLIAARNRVNDVPSTPLFPRQSLGDRVLLTLQVILLTIFTSFYFFSSTQPLFEYDVVEYHAQAAREIFETGVLSFSPNNVYANMPLGAESLYVGGFNLVRDLCAAPNAPLRLGSLVGKVVLTASAFATALGLFAFCVRFFRSGRAGLFAALFYLAFPGVFDVFANGLNDGALGFALFAAFYAFALSLAADATRWSRLVFRVATCWRFDGCSVAKRRRLGVAEKSAKRRRKRREGNGEERDESGRENENDGGVFDRNGESDVNADERSGCDAKNNSVATRRVGGERKNERVKSGEQRET